MASTTPPSQKQCSPFLLPQPSNGQPRELFGSQVQSHREIVRSFSCPNHAPMTSAQSAPRLLRRPGILAGRPVVPRVPLSQCNRTCSALLPVNSRGIVKYISSDSPTLT